jgi:6-pyruvoyltetrahydropterin/6-carboxytetrahydropterin synthase
MFTVTKTYGHDLGLSCCFRQPLAQSHCRVLHGYALSFTIVFMSDTLNENNWVIDFGSLKPIKEWLTYMYDHTTVIAENDPMLDTFVELNDKGIIDLRIAETVGCEAFARDTFEFVRDWLASLELKNNVWVSSVTVREHGANAATYAEA